MISENLKLLFNNDIKSFSNNNIDDALLKQLDTFILTNIDKSFNIDVFNVYKKFMGMKQEAPDSMKTVLFSTIRNYSADEMGKGNFLESLVLYRFLIVKTVLDSADYLNIAKNLVKLQDMCIYKQFLELYSNNEENKLLVQIELADIYKGIKDYKSAIECYEKFLEIDKTKVSIYTITADLYAKLNGSESLNRQIELYEQAYKIQPDNRLILHGLAFAYEKIGNNNKADVFYQKLLQFNPTENDYYNYGGFLIHSGNFIKGHEYFTHRFNIDDINLRYPSDITKKWDMKSDISDKVLLVHYEQGFGDTIMYSRFVPFLKALAKDVIFVVQKELYNLILNSQIFKDVSIVTDENDANYDVNISLLDVPYVLKIDSDNIPYTSKYIDVSNELVKNYQLNYLIKNNGFNVGLSCRGESDSNYNGRDIEILKLYSVLKDIPNINFYNLQSDNENCGNMVPLGRNFKDFIDSACAVKNMDLIISTDNVILNLAGAMGTKTVGLFNKETNYRWFKTEGENVGWYDSVKPLQVTKQNQWYDVLFSTAELLKSKVPCEEI